MNAMRWFVLLSLLVTPRAFAWDPAGGVYAIGKVVFIQANGNGSFTIRLANFPALCTTASDNTVGEVVNGKAGVTPEGLKTLLSVAQTSMLSGKSVKVYAENNGVPGTWGCNVGAMDLLN